MQVFKFGGASVKDAEDVKNLAEVLRQFPDQKIGISLSTMRKIFCFVLLFFCLKIFSQNRELDSLYFINLYSKAEKFNEQNSDSSIFYIQKSILFAETKKQLYNKIYALGFYGSLCENIGDNRKADSLYKKAIILSKQAPFYDLLSNNYLCMGILYYRKGEYKKALEYDLLALKTDSLYKSKDPAGKIYQNIGNVYNSLGNFPLALNYFYMSIKEFQKENKFVGIGGSYCNIGNIYDSQNDYDNAIKSYKTALFYLNKTTNIGFKIITITNLGISLEHKNLHDSALYYYFIALKQAEEIDNISFKGNVISNIAVTYIHQKKFKEAEEYLLKSNSISEELGDSSSLAEIKINLGDCYLKTKKNKQAIDNFYQGYIIAKNIGENVFKIHALHGLYDAYFANNQYKEAAIYLQECFDLKDSIFNIENSEQLSDLKTNFEVEKKETELQAKAEAQKLITAEEKKRQQLIIYAVAGVLLLVVIFSIFLYKRFAITRKQNVIIEKQKFIVEQKNHLIEEKHKEITDSINYAERIQRAMLASKLLLKENSRLLSGKEDNYFILFKPKDVVSGDFYWAAKLNQNQFCLVTADSTGHGVPGAIMSMLNMNSLKESITKGLTEADDILNYTRTIIINTLANDGSETGGKDGMDCSLMIFDYRTLCLSWVAANNPIWVIRNAGQPNCELMELKPQKMPVGKHERQNELFVKQTLQLQKNDIVYAITDGYPDQFGGEKGKKFMSKNLKELLQINAHLSMEAQHELLDQTFKNWVGELEQVDDVTIIGVKI